MAVGNAGRTHWRRFLISPAAQQWIEQVLGRTPRDPALYLRALTHGSAGADNYERLEFLGDRVLGFVIAEWLFELFPAEREGQLSHRLNRLVAGSACAEIARETGLPPHIRLGKQALDDGARDSDNVLGDVLEALIGALYNDHGLDAARDAVRALWSGTVQADARSLKHPKSALQEWAAAHRRKPPVYEILDRSGAHHAPLFRIRVSIAQVGEAVAEGTSKQEAETAAATALLEQIT